MVKIVYFGNDMFSSCLKYLINERHHILRVYKNKLDLSASTIASLCSPHKIPLAEDKPTLNDLNQLILMGAKMFIDVNYKFICK